MSKLQDHRTDDQREKPSDLSPLEEAKHEAAFWKEQCERAQTHVGDLELERGQLKRALYVIAEGSFIEGESLSSDYHGLDVQEIARKGLKAIQVHAKGDDNAPKETVGPEHRPDGPLPGTDGGSFSNVMASVDASRLEVTSKAIPEPDSRCKHGIHGDDCFECYPYGYASKAQTNSEINRLISAQQSPNCVHEFHTPEIPVAPDGVPGDTTRCTLCGAYWKARAEAAEMDAAELRKGWNETLQAPAVTSAIDALEFYASEDNWEGATLKTGYGKYDGKWNRLPPWLVARDALSDVARPETKE